MFIFFIILPLRDPTGINFFALCPYLGKVSLSYLPKQKKYGKSIFDEVNNSFLVQDQNLKVIDFANTIRECIGSMSDRDEDSNQWNIL